MAGSQLFFQRRRFGNLGGTERALRLHQQLDDGFHGLGAAQPFFSATVDELADGMVVRGVHGGNEDINHAIALPSEVSRIVQSPRIAGHPER